MANVLRCGDCGWSVDIPRSATELDVKELAFEHITKRHTAFYSNEIKREIVMEYLAVDSSAQCAVCQEYHKKDRLLPIKCQCGEHMLDGYICARCHSTLFHIPRSNFESDDEL